MFLREFFEELVDIYSSVRASGKAAGAFDVQVYNAELEVLVYLSRSLHDLTHRGETCLIHDSMSNLNQFTPQKQSILQY